MGCSVYVYRNAGEFSTRIRKRECNQRIYAHMRECEPVNDIVENLTFGQRLLGEGKFFKTLGDLLREKESIRPKWTCVPSDSIRRDMYAYRGFE